MKLTKKQFWTGIVSAIFVVPFMSKLASAKDIIELKQKEKPTLTRVVGIVIDGHGKEITVGYKDEETVFFDGVIENIVYSENGIKAKIMVNDSELSVGSTVKKNDIIKFSIVENTIVTYVKIKIIIKQEVDV